MAKVIKNAISSEYLRYKIDEDISIYEGRFCIYLDRKYNKYLEFCRLEEESSKRLSSKIGEGCDANPEVISEITKGLEIP